MINASHQKGLEAKMGHLTKANFACSNSKVQLILKIAIYSSWESFGFSERKITELMAAVFIPTQ